MTDHSYVGTSTPRVDGAEKVTGRALYAADQRVPGALWGKVLLSHRTHATIVRIDTREAEQLPGVHAVITAADVGGGLYGRRIKDMPVLAVDRVRYFGERVAAVAAVDLETAQRALDRIEVEYEDLPAVYDIPEALEPSAPTLHPGDGSYPGSRALPEPSNRYDSTLATRGDVEAAFEEADLVIENTYRTQRVHQAYLEPHASLVSIAGERIDVWTNTKVPYAIRDSLAIAAGIPAEQIVLHHSSIGGDFGGKGTPLDLPICYFLARASGRPVRIVADYIEEFMAGNPRHATLVRLKTGLRRDGTITAHQVEFFVNAGAYAAYKPGGRINGAPHAAGPYRVPNTSVESIQVYTNTVPGGHMRAPGAPQAVFALESHLDEIARKLDIDPLEFRLRNLIGPGDEAASGQRLTDARVRETLQAAVEAADYGRPRPPFTGVGVAIGDHGAAGGEGSARVSIRPDGTIVLGTPIFDQGSGTYTTLQQVVAQELDVPLSRVRVEVWDTGAVDSDSGVGGSRATRVNTAAAYDAARDARRALVRFLAGRLTLPEGEIELHGGDYGRAGGETIGRWQELLAESGETLVGQAHVEQPITTDMTGFVAQVAEVSVDPETGEVCVLRLTTAHDVGRVLNPVNHQGQINGGVVQGLGYALMEELTVEEGRVTSLSFGDYKIPTSRDVPELQTVLVSSEQGHAPFNVKGIGETPNTPVAAAIANAVADAVGVRIRELPITAEKIYWALKERDGA